MGESYAAKRARSADGEAVTTTGVSPASGLHLTEGLQSRKLNERNRVWHAFEDTSPTDDRDIAILEYEGRIKVAVPLDQYLRFVGALIERAEGDVLVGPESAEGIMARFGVERVDTPS